MNNILKYHTLGLAPTFWNKSTIGSLLETHILRRQATLRITNSPSLLFFFLEFGSHLRSLLKYLLRYNLRYHKITYFKCTIHFSRFRVVQTAPQSNFKHFPHPKKTPSVTGRWSLFLAPGNQYSLSISSFPLFGTIHNAMSINLHVFCRHIHIFNYRVYS